MSLALNPLFAFAAGALTILSPCVLPLVPIVLGSAMQRSRWGPLALSAGLVVSFTAVGLALASLGTLAGFDGDAVRVFGAILLLAVGLLLIVPGAQDALSRLATPLANWASHRQDGLARFGLAGQAGIGVLLGLVWSPCVGPTLGAATVLAGQGGGLLDAAIVMAAFGLGIAVTLLAIGFATRGFLSRWRGRMMTAGSRGKLIFGGLMIAVALMILTGIDHKVEGVLISISPDWLVSASTSV
ncbi:cytochrome c biogenesis CcdA family protein [Sphingomonas faeni]|uniref:cytochrome c biogenesis CcdA family protein n=1 Tax=Sphingomonas faeni TaxID=185950 RepID=UPI003361AB34